MAQLDAGVAHDWEIHRAIVGWQAQYLRCNNPVITIMWAIFIWVCLKMGYTPNYSHLIGIMIINHWV